MRSKLISSPTNFNHLVHVGLTDRKPSVKDPPLVSPPEPITSLPGEAEPITASPVRSAYLVPGPSARPAGGWLQFIGKVCCAAEFSPSALPPNRLLKRRAEVPAAPSRSGPTASRRPRGAQPQWAAMETRTPVRTAPQPPVPPRFSPKFPPPIDPSNLTLDFCPLILFLEQ